MYIENKVERPIITYLIESGEKSKSTSLLKASSLARLLRDERGQVSIGCFGPLLLTGVGVSGGLLLRYGLDNNLPIAAIGGAGCMVLAISSAFLYHRI